MTGARLTDLPKGYALCPVCRERAYRNADVGVCSKCRGNIAPIEPPFKISCVVPFDRRLSKNRQKTPFKGKMILTRDARRSSAALVKSLVDGMVGKPRETKMRVAVMVHKPDHRMDAVNFLDVISDCVQKACGLNDKWYSATVDWAIDRENPRIEIEVGQGE